MIKKIKIKSDFTKNVITLMTGTTIAQAIPIAISPILTRIYTPEDFGVLALFIGLTSILSIIATGRYELAIMLPKKEDYALHIAVLAMTVSLIISLIIFIIFFLFNSEITSILGNKEISTWLYWVPITIFIISCYQSLNFLNIRKKHFKTTATSKVIQSTTISALSIFLGSVSLKNIGLVTGQILGQFVSFLYLLRNSILYSDFNLKKVRLIKLILLAKRYQNFPKIVTLTGALNTSSVQVPIFVITALFSAKVVGFYSFAQRIITIPDTLIAGSIGQVFYQEVSNRASIDDKSRLFQNTLKRLLIIASPIFAFILVFGDKIFSIIFGKEWIIAGEFAQVMSLWLYLVFVVSPLSQLYNILEKQKTFLQLNILSFILRIISLFIGGVLFKNVMITLYLFVGSSVLSWFIILSVMLNYLKIKKIKIVLEILLYFLIYSLFFEFIKLLVLGVFNV